MSLVNSIRGKSDKKILYTVDVLSQPNGRTKWFQSDPHLHTKCSRALPIARKEDVVVLSGNLNQEYYDWLKEHDFTTSNVVVYDKPASATPLAEYILADPEPVKVMLGNSPQDFLYTPFYCSDKDIKAAQLLGIDVLGADESITLKYFDKSNFKELCKKLEIPAIISSNEQLSEYPTKSEMAEVLEALLNDYRTLIVRGTVGSAGDSVYIVENDTVKNVLENIEKGHADKFLIEPYLNVISSPNDQWMITLDGELFYIGLSAQLFQGLSHTGNLHGQFFSSRVDSAVKDYSLRIANHMKDEGYKGVFGVDYIVTDEAIFPIENNARMNGSTFAFGIVERIEEKLGKTPCWKFFKSKLEKPCSFNELKIDIEHLIYDGKKKNGVFPSDIDTLDINGAFNCLIYAEDMYHLESISASLKMLGIRRL